mgnify:FL=1|tara:strand:- start:1138 stop:1317 length:180 start_codon:yes stop_codon:yes gene_type:complete
MPMNKQEQKHPILEEVRRHGNITRAATASDVSRRTIHYWRQSDPVFAAAMDAALIEGKS